MSAPVTISSFYPITNIGPQIRGHSFWLTPKLAFSTQSVFLYSRDYTYSSPVAMAESSKTHVFRGTTTGGDELEGGGGVRSFEQEAFIHGSSQISSDLTSDGDGVEATINNLSKWLVTASFGLVLLWRHDAEALWAAMGSVINSGLSTILKHTLNQERPVSNLRSDPGMPSSHAQAIFFLVIFAITSMTKWLGVNWLTITLSGLVLALGSYLSWLRVSQQLHTVSQVVVGAVVGSTVSILWFWSWDAYVLQAFVSHLWVRIIVVMGAAGFCVGFLLYIIRFWIADSQ